MKHPRLDPMREIDFEWPVILIVDDEQGPRESLRMILSPSHRVLTASGGSEALEILRTTDVDLVTLDLNMPGIKGDQLAGIIRDDFPEIELIIITGFGTLETAINGIRQGVCDFLTKPFDVVQVNSAVSRALRRQQGKRRLVCFLEGLGQVLGRNRTANDILSELESDQKLQSRLRTLLEETSLRDGAVTSGELDPQTIEFLELLAQTIESRDPGMRGHAQRVAHYTTLITNRLQLDEAFRQQARVAAFLHDLGKVGLPTDVLPPGEVLTDAQRAAVQQHPLISERLIRPLALPSGIPSALRHHHERWDGRGYPDGLRGENIPLMARILAIADVFDAMVYDSSFQPAYSHDEAIKEMRDASGTQFDPELLDVFLSLAENGSLKSEQPPFESMNANSPELATSLGAENNG